MVTHMKPLKLNPPITIQGQMTIQADTTTISTKQIIVERVDNDGFLCVECEPIPTSTRPLGQFIDSILGKSRAYDVYAEPENKGFNVVSRSDGARTIKNYIDIDLLLRTHRIVSQYPEIRFNALKRELKPGPKDAVHLMSILAVLEATGHVKRNREGKAVYYRTVKDWSLDVYK
jgi:hypothetical protein